VQARHRTGRGQYVETSLLEAATALQVYEASHYFTFGTNPPRTGQSHRGSSPYQVFPSADGFVTIGAGQQRFYEALCRLADIPELIGDVRFSSMVERVLHNDVLIDLLSTQIRKRSTAWWITELEKLGVPCGPVFNHQQVFEDPQVLSPPDG